MTELVTLEAGAVFARDFRVVRRLASGGMGAVYVAEQLSTGKERALKVMHPQLLASAKNRERFAQEARAAGRIDSDHVVEVVGAGVDDATGMPWLAMELLRGEELAAVVARRRALPPAEAREVLEQLCHALAAAHAVGIVHRDLKPENVFVAQPRRQGVPFMVKVLDFGIAKLIEEGRMAATGTAVIGSPKWMAPEQCEGAGRISPATDVWALGLLAYYLLVGRSYWRAANAEATSLQALLREMLVEPLEPASARARAWGAALPAGFDAWFARCVARDASERFQDAGAAASGLGDALAAGAPSGAPAATVFGGPTAPPVGGTVLMTEVPAALAAAAPAKTVLMTGPPPDAAPGPAPPPGSAGPGAEADPRRAKGGARPIGGARVIGAAPREPASTASSAAGVGAPPVALMESERARGGGGGWIVPAVLGLALVGVLGYRATRAPSPGVVAAQPARASDEPGAGAAAARGPSADAPQEIRASHLLVMYQGSLRAPPAITRSREDARARAEEARRRAAAGEDFAALAREYSDEPGVDRRGGDLGRFRRGMMVGPFETAAFALDVGEVSGVVETAFGYHVIRRSE